jgi:1-acyl-sn-glycerol-3-phosphate acyltransferase
MKRSTFRSLLRFLFDTLTRVTVIGLEHMPRTGGCVVAVNHLSRLDPPLVFVLIDREDVTALVADKYKNYPFIPWIVHTVDGIWLHREESDLHALREARDFLRAGGVLGIAPEGTRSRVGSLIPAKTGAAYLADKAGVPVIPVAISGTDEAVWKIFLLLRPRITIQFGPPVHLEPIRHQEREAILLRNTDEIMCQIAAMLPEKYRGVYAGHPRLQEILQQRDPVDAHPYA